MQAGIAAKYPPLNGTLVGLLAEPIVLSSRSGFFICIPMLLSKYPSCIPVMFMFWDFVRKLKTRAREGDQAGFHKHLKTMNLEGK